MCIVGVDQLNHVYVGVTAKIKSKLSSFVQRSDPIVSTNNFFGKILSELLFGHIEDDSQTLLDVQTDK